MQLKNFIIDVTPLRESRAFRYAYAARTASVLVTGMMLVAASIQLYDLSKSSLSVALLNVFMAVPMVIALLVGGVLSDRIDRRKLMMWSRSVYIISVLLFLINALMATPSVTTIYIAAMVGGAASGISIPAMMSATPALVGRQHLASAAALSGLSLQLGGVLGPLLAGALIAGPGLVVCYVIVLAGVMLTPFLLSALPPLPPKGGNEKATTAGQAFIEGFRYMLSTPLLRNLLLIDLAAVFFATPLALLPEWGDVVLGQGATVTGALYAAPAIGAAITALSSGWIRSVQRPGITIIAAVFIWGLAVVSLSLSTHLYPSMLALAIMGSADTISKMLRMTLVQRHTPDHLLGRMSALWMTQSSIGTAAGNLQMGTMSRWFSPSIALLVGGCACSLSAGLFASSSNALKAVNGKP
ncbi:enterobactin transporter EntS [Paenalcaligenes niemegkensis]|uniref:enterobactin transporter EntS n=1 Tax=Paenalcaligenes niemegkensis TaxID=2895469 RepID=UPI001EE8742B|nr:enterobactin transporter EntS [Paenalcaligenes niemegkensis]MCQ9617593.1 enterobactin transporter EntS [Paenalcaligenes niemegkensis]